MDNEGISNVLSQVADLLEIEGASPFRVRAYRGASRTVGALASPAGSLPDKGPGSLEELPGIGKDLAQKIRDLAETGELALLHELKERIPESLIHLLEIPGLGPKRAKAIHEGLGIDTIDALEKAAREGKLRALKGVGPKLEAQILEGIAARAVRGKRILLSEAEAQIEPIVARLREAPGVTRIEVAGSYRRRRDNVGDVDILVAAEASANIGKLLLSDPQTEKVLADGDTKTSVVLKSGLQVDLRVVPAESFGAALHYFTGSKAHNIAIRTLGVRKKLKINEYGVFEDSNRVSGEREEDIFASVGLGYVPPELREDHGEIDGARDGKLPTLAELADVRGDLVEFSSAAELEAIVKAAHAKKYGFLIVLGPREIAEPGGEVARQTFLRAIEEVRGAGVKIFSAATVSLQENGTLDADEATLGEIDVLRAEVRDPRALQEKALTQMIASAVKQGRARIFARPTGVFMKDKPAQIDPEALVKAAKHSGVVFELDARPERLAGADGFARVVKDAGGALLLASHASSASELDRVRYGLDQARRGWCEAKDLANARDGAALDKALARRT